MSSFGVHLILVVFDTIPLCYNITSQQEMCLLLAQVTKMPNKIQL